MPWTRPIGTAGQEAYEMENVGDYRKVDTVPKNPEDVDGAEPSAPAPEWVRSAGGSLDERYGERAPDESPEGKYPIPTPGDPARGEASVEKQND